MTCLPYTRSTFVSDLRDSLQPFRLDVNPSKMILC